MKLKKFNQYLTEEYLEGEFMDQTGRPYKVYQLLFYAFDWDDNILKMPTEIFLLDSNGDEIGMSTQDFAEYRSLIGKEEFSYENRTIVGYSKDPFRYFRDEVDADIFVKDVKLGVENKMFAKSWEKFIECLTTGALFAIITARGHESGSENNSGPMRRGVRTIIDSLNSEQKQRMIDHLKMFAHLYDKPMASSEELIENYLDHCEFIGVSAPSRGGAPDNPEAAKEEAFLNFVDKCDYLAKDLENRLNEDIETIKKGDVWKVKAKIGFSDDDSKNYEHIDDVVKNLNNETYSNVEEFHVIYTGIEDKKQVYKKESKIFNFSDFKNISETSEQTPGLESSVMSCTQFGNMSGQLNPTDIKTRQDDYHNQLLRQTDYLTKMSREVRPKRKKKKNSD